MTFLRSQTCADDGAPGTQVSDAVPPVWTSSGAVPTSPASPSHPSRSGATGSADDVSVSTTAAGGAGLAPTASMNQTGHDRVHHHLSHQGSSLIHADGSPHGSHLTDPMAHHIPSQGHPSHQSLHSSHNFLQHASRPQPGVTQLPSPQHSLHHGQPLHQNLQTHPSQQPHNHEHTQSANISHLNQQHQVLFANQHPQPLHPQMNMHFVQQAEHDSSHSPFGSHTPHHAVAKTLAGPTGTIHNSINPISASISHLPGSLPSVGGISGAEPPAQPPTQNVMDSASSNQLSYSNLQDGIMNHCFFPLVVKKLFEVLGEKPFSAPHLTPYYAQLEQRAEELQHYGETYGVEGACEKFASVDLFMSAMVSSLATIKSRMASGSVDALLVETLNIVKGTLRSSNMTVPHQASPSQRTSVNPSQHHGLSDQILAPIQDRGSTSNPGVFKNLRSRTLDDSVSLPRRKLKPQARRCLEDWFQSHLNSPYPTEAEKIFLANQCQLDVQQVNNYFGNKRMRMKRKMMALSSHSGRHESAPKSAPSADSVLAPKSKWRAVVLSRLESPMAREVVGAASTGGNQQYTVHPDNSYALEANRRVGSAPQFGVMRRDAVPPSFGMHRRGQPMDPFYCEEEVSPSKTPNDPSFI